MLSPFSQAISNIKSPFLNRRRGGDTSPLALFAGGAIGVWFDPSDVANLDWRRNLLTQTETLTNAAWINNPVITVTSRVLDPNIGNTAFTLTATTNNAEVYQTFTGRIVGQAHTSQCWMRRRTGSGLIQLYANSSQTNVVLTSSWQLVTLTQNASATTIYFGFRVTVSGDAIDVWHPQFELGSVATDYQKITDVDREVMERFPTTTMFKDAAGTSPVTTPGDPVGLRLDKSKGLVLGPELVTNGDFSIPVTTGWSAFLGASLSVDNGRLKVTSTGANPYAVYAISTIANKWYSFTVSYDAAAHSGQLAIYPARNTTGTPLTAMPNVTGSGVRSCYFMATDTTSYVHVQGITVTSGVSIFFDNISVRELPGNHASQSTIAARPTYGIEPRGGRRNLQIRTQDFANAYWEKTGGSITATNVIAPDGTATASTLTGNGTNYTSVTGNPIIGHSGQFTESWYVKAGTETKCELWPAGGGGPLVRFDLAAVTATVSGGTTAFITPVGNEWFRVGVYAAAYGGRPRLVLGYNAPTVSTSMYIWGVQVDAGSTVTPYQKVTTEYDVTEAGVPTRHYVAYGGAHHMVTNSIDFTVTDKMSVFAGMRKLSETTGFLLETGTNFNPRGITIYNNVDGRYSLGGHNGFGFMGYYAATISAPASSVLSMGYDISGVGSRDSEALFTRVNGVTSRSGTEGPWAEGTGNFAANPLYIGRRAGTSFPFNGRDYGIIVVGKTVSAAEITATETWLFDKTGIFAPIITGVPTIGAS